MTKSSHLHWICLIAILAFWTSFPSGAVQAEDLATPTSTQSPDDLAANELAREIFRGDEYWWKRTADVKTGSLIGDFVAYVYNRILSPILKGIGKLIGWILDALFGRIRMPHGDWSKGIPFLWTLIALLLAFVSWRLIQWSRSGPMVRPLRAEPGVIDLLPQREELLKQAAEALEKGDHRAAIRLAFLSMLAWLQDLGQLRYDPSRSNREYQRDLRAWPNSVATFRAAADPFERCWYGGRDLPADQIRDVIVLCRREFQRAKGTE